MGAWIVSNLAWLGGVVGLGAFGLVCGLRFSGVQKLDWAWCMPMALGLGLAVGLGLGAAGGSDDKELGHAMTLLSLTPEDLDEECVGGTIRQSGASDEAIEFLRSAGGIGGTSISFKKSDHEALGIALAEARKVC